MNADAFDAEPARDAHLREATLRSEQVYRGSFLDVRRDAVRLPDGATAAREYIVHPGAVMVVPLLDDGRLVIERQWRYPLARAMLEFPAGKLEVGEAAMACAVRELAEETGYVAAEWARAGILHNAIAYSNEGIEVWFARGLMLGERRLDAGEFLDVPAPASTNSTPWPATARSPMRRRWSACSGCRIGAPGAGRWNGSRPRWPPAPPFPPSADNPLMQAPARPHQVPRP